MVNYYVLRKEEFNMEMREKKISGEVIFDGKILKVERDKVLCPNGNTSFREVIRHNGGAGILCITPNDEVLLIKQFRYAYDEVIYEIPAGKLEKDEDPYEAALREFEEETGNKASKLELLSVIYPTCGYSAEKIYLYLATDYIQTKVSLDEDEIIITELIPLDKVLEMIDNGTIRDAKTICAITTYVIRYKK
jgi:ADP-ribose pyrophosphatase